jgi:gamma-glutamyl hercynylcysteine S-oxide synthase
MNHDDMVRIDSTRFIMGSDLYKNEGLIREVFLSTYLIDLYPVTNFRFSKFINLNGYNKKEYWTQFGWDFINTHKIQEPLYWHDEGWNHPNQPVTGISWWEALAFALFEGKTLCTEAQWEYMASGGKNTYPWGEQEPNINKANYAEDCEPSELNRTSREVNFYEAGRSHCGCWDVSGNLNEWCIDNASDNYRWDFYKVNPVFLHDECSSHIVKGGSGLHDADCLRCASRDYYSPTLRDNIVGFRCVVNE